MKSCHMQYTMPYCYVASTVIAWAVHNVMYMWRKCHSITDIELPVLDRVEILWPDLFAAFFVLCYVRFTNKTNEILTKEVGNMGFVPPAFCKFLPRNLRLPCVHTHTHICANACTHPQTYVHICFQKGLSFTVHGY